MARLISKLAIDIITSLLLVYLINKEVVDTIIVIIDRFSKYTRYFAVPIEYSSKDLAEMLAPKFLRYRILDSLVTNYNPRYISKF